MFSSSLIFWAILCSHEESVLRTDIPKNSCCWRLLMRKGTEEKLRMGCQNDKISARRVNGAENDEQKCVSSRKIAN